MKEYDSRTAIRLPGEQRKKIDALIREGKFKNLSQVVRAALTVFLAKTETENSLPGGSS